jgi:hypothetical protein
VSDIWDEDSIQHNSQRSYGLGRELGVVSRHPFQHRVVARHDTWIGGRNTLGFDGVDDVEDECRGRG